MALSGIQYPSGAHHVAIFLAGGRLSKAYCGGSSNPIPATNMGGNAPFNNHGCGGVDGDTRPGQYSSLHADCLHGKPLQKAKHVGRFDSGPQPPKIGDTQHDIHAQQFLALGSSANRSGYNANESQAGKA
jgi:hypothetical protein